MRGGGGAGGAAGRPKVACLAATGGKAVGTTGFPVSLIGICSGPFGTALLLATAALPSIIAEDTAPASRKTRSMATMFVLRPPSDNQSSDYREGDHA